MAILLLLVISDFHGNIDVLPKLRSVIRETSPDAAIFTGDVVKGYARGDEWLEAQKNNRQPKIIPEILNEEKEDLDFYETFFKFFETTGLTLFVIPGNMDAPVERYSSEVVQRYQGSATIRFVHNEIQEFGELIFGGFGGELVPSGTESYFVRRYLEEEAIDSLQRLVKIESVDKLALLFHHPPEGRVGDDDGIQKGSRAINQIIETQKPLYVFCGHVHRARAIEKVNNTTVINPGALKDGCYALVDTTTKKETLFK